MSEEKVMAFVERELAKNPDVSSSDLYDAAKKVSRTVSGLTLRQFHAKYPLQVKRRSKTGGAKSGGAKPSAKRKTRARKTTTRRAARGGTGARRKSAAKPASGSAEVATAIRGLMLDFALQVSTAEGKAATIEALSNVDNYVSQALDIARA